MAVTETYFISSTVNKIFRSSGQFTSTIRSSVGVGAVDSVPADVTWDGINTPWCGSSADKLYLQSGNFTSTVKTSLSIGAKNAIPDGIDADINNNTPWSGHAVPYSIFLQSGQFSSVVKNSLDVTSLGTPHGICFDGTNTVLTTFGPSILYRLAGQFTSTVLESQSVDAVDITATGGVFDGLNTPWCGLEANKLYLQSGYFTSTLKTSLSVTTPRGIDVDDYQARQGFVIPPSPGIKPSRSSQVPREDTYEEKVEIETRKTEEEAWMVEKVMTKSELEKEKVIEDTNALILGVKDLI